MIYLKDEDFDVDGNYLNTYDLYKMSITIKTKQHSILKFDDLILDGITVEKGIDVSIQANNLTISALILSNCELKLDISKTLTFTEDTHFSIIKGYVYINCKTLLSYSYITMYGIADITSDHIFCVYDVRAKNITTKTLQCHELLCYHIKANVVNCANEADIISCDIKSLYCDVCNIAEDSKIGKLRVNEFYLSDIVESYIELDYLWTSHIEGKEATIKCKFLSVSSYKCKKIITNTLNMLSNEHESNLVIDD